MIAEIPLFTSNLYNTTPLNTFSTSDSSPVFLNLTDEKPDVPNDEKPSPTPTDDETTSTQASEDTKQDEPSSKKRKAEGFLEDLLPYNTDHPKNRKQEEFCPSLDKFVQFLKERDKPHAAGQQPPIFLNTTEEAYFQAYLFDVLTLHNKQFSEFPHDPVEVEFSSENIKQLTSPLCSRIPDDPEDTLPLLETAQSMPEVPVSDNEPYVLIREQPPEDEIPHIILITFVALLRMRYPRIVLPFRSENMNRNPKNLDSPWFSQHNDLLQAFFETIPIIRKSSNSSSSSAAVSTTAPRKIRLLRRSKDHSQSLSPSLFLAFRIPKTAVQLLASKTPVSSSTSSVSQHDIQALQELSLCPSPPTTILPSTTQQSSSSSSSSSSSTNWTLDDLTDLSSLSLTSTTVPLPMFFPLAPTNPPSSVPTLSSLKISSEEHTCASALSDDDDACDCSSTTLPSPPNTLSSSSTSQHFSSSLSTLKPSSTTLSSLSLSSTTAPLPTLFSFAPINPPSSLPQFSSLQSTMEGHHSTLLPSTTSDDDDACDSSSATHSSLTLSSTAAPLPTPFLLAPSIPAPTLPTLSSLTISSEPHPTTSASPLTGDDDIEMTRSPQSTSSSTSESSILDPTSSFPLPPPQQDSFVIPQQPLPPTISTSDTHSSSSSFLLAPPPDTLQDFR